MFSQIMNTYTGIKITISWSPQMVDKLKLSSFLRQKYTSTTSLPRGRKGKPWTAPLKQHLIWEEIPKPAKGEMASASRPPFAYLFSPTCVVETGHSHALPSRTMQFHWEHYNNWSKAEEEGKESLLLIKICKAASLFVSKLF